MTIDTRERKEDRINRLWMYFENLGAEVKRETLHDFDYHVGGEYKGWEIDLGIEYKTVNDIVSNWKELPERFARAYEHVTELALFVEGHITTTRHQDDGKVYVENSTADQTGEVMTYATYQSKLMQFAESGIHVWNFNSIRDFPVCVENLVNHITNVPHTMLEFPRKDVRRDRFAFYQCIPGIGGKAAVQLSEHDLVYWLQNEDELLATIKPSKTKKILEFVGVRDE